MEIEIRTKGPNSRSDMVWINGENVLLEETQRKIIQASRRILKETGVLGEGRQ